MLWVTLIVALILSGAAIAWVIWPLTRRGPAPLLVEDDRLAELLGRKDAIMAAIKDLEFDHKVGKLSEEDFQRYDQRLRRQAIGLIQQIEQLAPESTGLDATLEAEIAQRRKVSVTRPLPTALQAAAVQQAGPVQAGPVQAGPVQAGPVQAGPVAVAVGVASNGHTSGAGRFCTECGNRLEPQHKFCAQCGAPAAR